MLSVALSVVVMEDMGEYVKRIWLSVAFSATVICDFLGNRWQICEKNLACSVVYRSFSFDTKS
jgi:hypothetical protein